MISNAYRVLTGYGTENIVIHTRSDGSVVLYAETSGDQILRVTPAVANELIRGLQHVLTSQGHTTWFFPAPHIDKPMRPEDV